MSSYDNYSGGEDGGQMSQMVSLAFYFLIFWLLVHRDLQLF